MNILVPFKGQAKIEDFINAGAKEFYLGFYDENFTDKFGKYTDLNRMSGFSKRANPFTFKECIESINKINNSGGSAFLTLNSSAYSQPIINYIKENYLPGLKDSKVSGIITSDLHLARAIREFDIPIVASTICGIYNSDIAKAYFNNGFHRIIVPRDLSLNEIKEITEELPEAEYEVFFMRNGCVFSDCYCLGMHRRECGATCYFIKHHPRRFVTNKVSFEDRQEIDLNNKIYNETFHKETCGLCALYRLMDYNIGSLKIVGRSDNPSEIIRDIKLINTNIEIAQQSSDEEEYLKNMKFPDNRSTKCISGLSCYYPEVRFGA